MSRPVTSVEARKANAPIQPIYLEGKVVGHIYKIGDGFQYRPKGQKKGGKVFLSFVACVRSLEDE